MRSMITGEGYGKKGLKGPYLIMKRIRAVLGQNNLQIGKVQRCRWSTARKPASRGCGGSESSIKF